MKLWERFLRIIYRIAAKPFLKKYQAKSLESVLQKSLTVLDESALADVKNRVISFFNNDGGFADRGGKSDLYYSLFGCFVAEALSLEEIKPQLKEFVKDKIKDPSLSGVNLFCGAILYSKLHGFDSTTVRLRQKVEIELMRNDNSEYFYFIGLLTLYYLQDYRLILKLKKRIKALNSKKDSACSLAAAEIVIKGVLRKPNTISFQTFLHKQESINSKSLDSRLRGNNGKSENYLLSFYRGKGGFAAIQKAPIEDLLSTAVALYALNFIDADIKSIKPDCLGYVDGLYLNGGFRATELDVDIDIEYTFYGLLALGALSK